MITSYGIIAIAHNVNCIISLLTLFSGLLLCYIAIRAIWCRSKQFTHNNIKDLFPLACPIIAGPATFAALFNSIADNGFLQTLELLMIVMLITWGMLRITIFFAPSRLIKWTDRSWASVYIRVIPLAILSIRMILKGAFNLI